jgi:hypothetical protein
MTTYLPGFASNFLPVLEMLAWALCGNAKGKLAAPVAKAVFKNCRRCSYTARGVISLDGTLREASLKNERGMAHSRLLGHLFSQCIQSMFEST